MTEYSPANFLEYLNDIPYFLKPCVLRKRFEKIVNIIASIWHENVLGYLSLDISVFLSSQFSCGTLSENCLLFRTGNVHVCR